MAITYGAAAGTTITTFAMNETLPSDQTGLNSDQVRVSDDLSTAGNGNIGSGTNGIGNSYVGRLIVINLAGTQQRRMCTAESDEGTTFKLTVHADWDTQPVGGTDTVNVPYEPADIEDGGASGGIGLGSKTGLWELSNALTINSSGGLQLMRAEGLEADDQGSSVSVTVNGYLYSGYEASSKYVSGGIMTAYNNATGEPTYQFVSGSEAHIYDAIIWSSNKALKYECANGSDVNFYGTKIISLTNELHLYDSSMYDCAIAGKAQAATEIVRIDAGTTIDGLALGQVDTLDTVADTTTETVGATGVLFSNVTDLITLRDNKTWNMIDPIWSATLYSDFNDTAVTGTAAINDKRSVNVVVQESDGAKLQNALAIVYEGSNDNLVQELTTDANGVASGSFPYKEHSWTTGTGSTTTYSGHAFRVDKWLYTPFAAAQISTDKVSGTYTLIPDSNIVQTTQATAKSDGSGITWNDETNPSSIIEFTGGSGGTIGLAVGDTITGNTSGADGIVTEILTGDGTAGTIHLKTRDGVDFTPAGETINNGADGWTATFTAASQQDFSIWIDATTKSYQVQHDYFAALTSETTLTATGELIHEWGRDSQGRAIYKSGSDYSTERSNGKGVIVVNGGAGAVSHFTDDDGGTWSPPASLTVEVLVLDDSTSLGIELAHVLLLLDSDKSTQILNAATNSSGLASTSYTGSVPFDVVGWARQMDVVGTDYIPKDISGTVTAAGLSIVVRLEPIS